MVLLVVALGEIVLRIGALREPGLVELQCDGAASLLDVQQGLFDLDSVSGYRMRPNTCVRLQSSEYDEVLLRPTPTASSHPTCLLRSLQASFG
ncbi:MAG: hypothetical protein JO352_12535 [Chloroflexi bacterium]|nr:hypothetical protein [Chloroflexota bacterium]